MTPQEINEAVARKLGLKNFEVRDGFAAYQDPEDGIWKEVPHYSTSIAAAWDAVEQMSIDYEVIVNASRKKYWCHATGPTWKQSVMGEADTAPMAICLAFLKFP